MAKDKCKECCYYDMLLAARKKGAFSMESIITELFNEAVSRSELIYPKSDEYAEAVKERESAGDAFRATLTEVQKKLFDYFLDTCLSVSNIKDDETFKHGVSLGVRITAEAFLLNER